MRQSNIEQAFETLRDLFDVATAIVDARSRMQSVNQFGQIAQIPAPSQGGIAFRIQIRMLLPRNDHLQKFLFGFE